MTSISEKIKNPSLTIYLSKEFENNKEMVIKYKHDIELTIFNDIIDTIELYYDPNNEISIIKNDNFKLFFKYIIICFKK